MFPFATTNSAMKPALKWLSGLAKITHMLLLCRASSNVHWKVIGLDDDEYIREGGINAQR